MYSLQLGLDFVYNWSLAWQLSLPVTKCAVLQLGRSLGTGSYTINNINLPMCHKTRDLSILVDSEIKFKEHIYNITAPANQRAFLIKTYIQYHYKTNATCYAKGRITRPLGQGRYYIAVTLIKYNFKKHKNNGKYSNTKNKVKNTII